MDRLADLIKEENYYLDKVIAEKYNDFFEFYENFRIFKHGEWKRVLFG